MDDQKERNIIMTGVGKLFHKGPESQWFRCCGRYGLDHNSAILPPEEEAATDNMHTSGHDSIPRKLYLQTQAVGCGLQGPALDHSARSPTCQIMAFPRSPLADSIPHPSTHLPTRDLSYIICQESVNPDASLCCFRFQDPGERSGGFLKPSGHSPLDLGLDSHPSQGIST